MAAMIRVAAAVGTDGGSALIKRNLKSDDPMTLLEELVGTDPEQKNWKGIGIALLVIIMVLALVVTATILVTPSVEDTVKGKPFSFRSLLDSKLSPRPLLAQWIGPNTYVHRSASGEVLAVDMEANKTTFIMDNITFQQLDTDRYWVSSDLKFVLLAYSIGKVNRYTRLAFYKIFDTKSKKLRSLPEGEETELIHASWGPTGNSLAYVYKNCLYHKVNVFTDGKAITQENAPAHIFNAMPDWLYEEEILRRDHAYWWSPTGQFIAYAIINDENVPKYQFPHYTDQLNVAGSLSTIWYPKAGNMGKNPSVELFVSDVPRTSRKTLIKPPDILLKGEYYLLEVVWQDEDKLAVTWMNRVQNLSMIMICLASTGACVPNLRATTKDGAVPWMEMDQKIVFTHDGGKNYFLLLPQQDGAAGYFQHVAMVTTNTNQEGHQSFLTHGQFDVTKVVGYDKAEQAVYVLAAYDSPLKRRLLKIGTIMSQYPKKVTCLTCDYANETCEYVDVTFSPSGKYYFQSCLGPDIPKHYLRSTENPNFNVTLDDNLDIQKKLDKLALPIKEYHSVRIGGGFNATMQLFLPPVLNKKHVIKYPVLLYIYGGPGSQLVNYKHISTLTAYYSSGQSMIVANIDGRGTAARGYRFKQDLYKNFGTVEVEDQLAAITFLRTLDYVDRDNIGVYGWSYGGFLAGHVVGRGSGLVQCAVLGAPVTDFRFYDTFYTERYMGSPLVSDNLNGYEKTSLMEKVEGFRKTKVLIIHGTSDDNVHFQHTAHLSRRLVKDGIQFEQQIYPDERHYFSPSANEHFFVRMTNFLNNCFNNATKDYVQNPAVREPSSNQKNG